MVNVANVADRFVSPLRQRSSEPYVTEHKQPDVTENMITHLRGLRIRENVYDMGFDAFACIVIDCDNIAYAHLVMRPPAPQSTDRDYYDVFLARIIRAYESRFSAL